MPSESSWLMSKKSKSIIPPTPSDAFMASIWDAVEGEFDSITEYFLLILIFCNVILLFWASVPLDEECLGDDCVRWGDEGSGYGTYFDQFEFFSVVIFTIEYVVRIWACMSEPEYNKLGPVYGRMKYMSGNFLIIDLLSVAPFWIYSAIPNMESPNFTTAIRIFRLIRLLKAEKYINAFSLLDDVLEQNKAILIASSFYASLIWIFASVSLFMIEQDNEDDDTAIMFQSIPASMYPTLMMLTGNVPDGQFSPLGKVVVGFLSLVGLGIFAIPTGVFASGFAKAIEKVSHEEMLG